MLPLHHQYSDSDIARKRAQEYFIRARDYERKGLTHMAQRFYEMALALDPQSKVLRDILLKQYISASNYPLALTLLQEADSLGREDLRLLASIYLYTGESLKAAEVLERIDGKEQEDVFSLSLLYESMGLESRSIETLTNHLVDNPQSFQAALKLIRYALLQKEFAQADSIIASLSHTHQDNPDLFSVKGAVNLLREDTAAALEMYNHALSLDTAHEESLQKMAQIHIHKENFAMAIEYYQRLEQNSLESRMYSFPLAVLHFYEENFEKAQSIFTELLEQSPDDPQLFYYLGKVYASTDRIDLAQQHYQKALEIEPENEYALLELSYLFMQNREHDKADSIVNTYREHYPQSVAPLRLKGYIHSFRKEYEQAVEAAQKALGFDSTSYGVWVELGSYLERNKLILEASDAFRQALSLRPQDPVASNYLGYMWAEKGINLDSAKILIETALKADPANGAYLDSYAWVFYQMGDYEKAYHYQKKAVARLNDDPVLFSHLGDILYKLGNRSGALQAYLKSLEMDSDESERIRKRVIKLKYLVEQKGE